MKRNPVILIIIDGYGISSNEKGNAVLLAKKPNLDLLMKNYPNTVLKSSGEAVGMPKNTIGNSEAGHMNIGAGRIVEHDLTRINKMIANGSFFRNPAFLNAIEDVKRKNTSLHLMGLLSDGGVHSHIDHLFALLQLANHHYLQSVFVHAFLDGRDVDPMSSKKYIRQLQKFCEKIGTGQIATIIGRFYAMDRDNKWNREHKAYDLMVNGKGILIRDPMEAVNLAYRDNLSDEFVKPVVLNQTGLVREGDSIIFFNFRSDRARELTRAFTQGKFNKFKRKKLIDLNFVCLTQYDKDFKLNVAFPHVPVKNGLSEFISKCGLKQLKIAETEKFAHVTHFFNGGNDAFKKEDRIKIKSPDVKTYDLKPEMSAVKITNEAIKNIKKKKYDLIVINFANTDMVGHTGKLKATIKAVEVVDKCIGKIYKEAEKRKGILVITSDHGNAEENEDKFERPKAADTANPVPLIITKKGYKLSEGNLADVAPTILKLLNLKKPKDMTGEVLIRK